MSHYTIEDFQGADIIDVRDVIARVEELREELESVKADQGEEQEEMSLQKWAESLDIKNSPFKDAIEELDTLEMLLQSLQGCGGDEQWEGDWYPVTLINEEYFETYMDEMLEDIGDMPKFKDIPAYLTITVDYDMLKQDYSEIEFDGNTYYYR